MVDLNGRWVVGICASAEWAYGGGANGSACFVWDGQRHTGLTLGAGVNVGYSVGIGFYGFYSNAWTIFELKGKSSCIAGGLHWGGSVCWWGSNFSVMFGGGWSATNGGASFEWNTTWVHWIHGFGFAQKNWIWRHVFAPACKFVRRLSTSFSFKLGQGGC